MIKFSKYFDNWLYGEDGYYANYKTIGKEGDFFTAVSTSSFFGGSIAKRIIDTIESGFIPKNTTIVEIGAHHGYLMADIIQFIYTLKPNLLNTLNFAIVERFENLDRSCHRVNIKVIGFKPLPIHLRCNTDFEVTVCVSRDSNNVPTANRTRKHNFCPRQ